MYTIPCARAHIVYYASISGSPEVNRDPDWEWFFLAKRRSQAFHFFHAVPNKRAHTDLFNDNTDQKIPSMPDSQPASQVGRQVLWLDSVRKKGGRRLAGCWTKKGALI